VVKGPKTFNLNNVYVDATVAVACGRRLFPLFQRYFFSILLAAMYLFNCRCNFRCFSDVRVYCGLFK
jgi:hypothetical protein